PNPFDPVRPGEREKIVDLFKDAARPAIFWRVADEPQTKTLTLDAVRPEVEQAWAIFQAAKHARDRAAAAALALQVAEKKGKSFAHTLDEQSREVGRPVVTLPNVS